MSLAELKLEAQQLGLTKEKVAEFGDLRKKVTWELAIAVQSQIQPNCQPQAEISNEYTEKAIDLKQKHNLPGYDEQALAKVMELAAKEVGVQNENSCMNTENAIADERLTNIPISFGKTRLQMLSGQKTVTRRLWKDDYAHQFIKRFSEGRTTYPAFDKDRRYGGKQIGIIRLTCSPYKERLSDMPESDLEKEGFPEITQQEFISRFFCGDSDLKVWVVRFKFTPDEMNKSESEIILTLFGPGLKVNDEHEERCFLRNEFVKLDESQIGRVTGIFTNNLVEIQLKTREIFSVTPSRLRHL